MKFLPIKIFENNRQKETCHVFSVGLGGGGGLLSVPDGLHLGEVGAVLVGEDGDN